MKVKCRHLIIGIIITTILYLSSSCALAENTNSDELDYDKSIVITVYPDDSIILTFRGNLDETFSRVEQQLSYKELRLFFNAEVEDESAIIENDFLLKLNPSDFANLANLDFDLIGHADTLTSNITTVIDYLGYLGVNGSLRVSIIEPPYGFILDIELETKLYYSFYSQEELRLFKNMIPMLETQIASGIMSASNGNIILDKIEILNFEESIDHTSFSVNLRISGDLQKGLQHALGDIDSDFTNLEDESFSKLSIESIDYHMGFNNRDLSFDVETSGILNGDFNEQLNKLKDLILAELLDNPNLNIQSRNLVELALPIELYAHNLVVESNTILDDGFKSTFYIDGLELKPESFDSLMIFICELSKQDSLRDFKLVFEGGEDKNHFVAFKVTENVNEPIVAEEKRLVWDMDEPLNLDGVNYEVKEKPHNTTTIIASSAIGLVILGAASYVLIRKM